MSEKYPPAIGNFHRLLLELPGLKEVSSGILSLTGVGEEELSLVAFADLPHAVLRRTKGGLDNEIFVQIEFYLSPEAVGWRSLANTIM